MSTSSTSSSSYRLNPSISDKNFKESCNTILRNSTIIQSRTISNVVAYDDFTKPYINMNNQIYTWYLAIGSMINPVSLHLRDLTPMISYPAKCSNYRLVFRGRCGMADIQRCEGDEFHGVVHLLPVQQMLFLDKIEHMYNRIVVNIVDYYQRTHLVYVYKMNLNGQQEKPIGIPSERYLDIIVKGCQHFGVHPSHINRLLLEQPVIPRKLPCRYETIGNIPEHIYYTNNELLKHDGKDPILPVWISINSKILEYKGLPPNDHPDYENQKQFFDFVLSYFAGREVAHIISKIWYEPMNTLPLDEDSLGNEHRGLAEDMCVSWGLNCGGKEDESYWKPIGRLDRTSTKDKL